MPKPSFLNRAIPLTNRINGGGGGGGGGGGLVPRPNVSQLSLRMEYIPAEKGIKRLLSDQRCHDDHNASKQ